MGLHTADPRANKEFWCTTCHQRHKPTEKHPICPCGDFTHLQFPTDLYIDFKGWRFRPPFHCYRCGIEVCPLQWAFSRSCGPCDCSTSHTARLHVCDPRLFAGKHELIDPNDSHLLAVECFLSPKDAEKYPVLDKPVPLAEQFLPPIVPLPPSVLDPVPFEPLPNQRKRS